MIGEPTPPSGERAHGESGGLAITAADRPSRPARRALAHIRARTISGRFACPLYDMPPEIWDAALDELRQANYPIAWTSGQVADDPAVTGGYVLADAPVESAR